MKKIFLASAMAAAIMDIVPGEALPQKMMKLDKTLRANSVPLSIKVRGGALMKFDFGSYKTLSAKAGFIKTTTQSKLFSSVESSESKQKASIVLLGNELDTSTINISHNVNSDIVRDYVISISQDRVALEKERSPSNFKETSNIVALITTSRDTAIWSLVYVSMVSTENSMENMSMGVVTDGNKNIKIRTVNEWDNGKSPTFYSIVGFEFYIDGIAVAAVQNPMDTFQKKFAWLKNDLNENMKLVLASAATVLLSFTNRIPT